MLDARAVARDWIDVIEGDRSLQPLGSLRWAACGKDPGFKRRRDLAVAQGTRTR
jgi:hypothetical protein